MGTFDGNVYVLQNSPHICKADGLFVIPSGIGSEKVCCLKEIHHQLSIIGVV